MPFWDMGAGDLLSMGAGFLGADRQNAANAKQAAAQMAFQERMSSTAHQREVKDLMQAGLNPILSASKGASTPGGAMATMQNTVASAQDSRRTSAEVRNLHMQNANIDADTWKKHTDRNVAESTFRLREQELATEQERTKSERWNAILQGFSAKGAAIEADIDTEGTGDWSRRIQRFLPVFNSAVGARGALSRGMGGAAGQGLRPRQVHHYRMPGKPPGSP